MKVFYRIGEVSERTGVPAHVLRHWETEFPQLRPRKGSGGQRLYSEEDLRLIERIRALLYDEKYTVEGARQVLAGRIGPPTPERVAWWAQELAAARRLLEDDEIGA